MLQWTYPSLPLLSSMTKELEDVSSISRSICVTIDHKVSEQCFPTHLTRWSGSNKTYVEELTYLLTKVYLLQKCEMLQLNPAVLRSSNSYRIKINEKIIE